MPIRCWRLCLTLIIVLLSSSLLMAQSAETSPGQPGPTKPNGPANLDTLWLDGHKCPLEGEARSDEEAALNRLRNRYDVPAEFESLTLSDLEKLPQGHALNGEVVEAPSSENPNNLRAATLTGQVVDVRMWGCGRRIVTLGRKREGRGTESSLCFTNDFAFCTVQIKVVEEPGSPSDTRKIFVVKVTARVRKLARRNQLKSNIGMDWSIDRLRARLLNHKVRFSGWLFYDAGYQDRAWITDPDDSIGKKNSIETAWGLQPVLGIEVLTNSASIPTKPKLGRKKSLPSHH